MQRKLTPHKFVYYRKQPEGFWSKKLPNHRTMPLLDRYPKETQPLSSRYICTAMFRAALLHYSKMDKTQNRLKCLFTNRNVKKNVATQMQMECSSAFKERRNLLFPTALMNLGDTMLGGISWTHKGRCRMTSFVRGIQTVQFLGVDSEWWFSGAALQT